MALPVREVEDWGPGLLLTQKRNKILRMNMSWKIFFLTILILSEP